MLDKITDIILYLLLAVVIIYFTKDIISAIFIAIGAFVAIRLGKKLFKNL